VWSPTSRKPQSAGIDAEELSGKGYSHLKDCRTYSIENEPLDNGMKTAKGTNKGDAQTPSTEAARPSVKKARRVAQPRQKGVRMVKLNFSVQEKTFERLMIAVDRRSSSKSALLAGAVERCLKDDVWSPKVRNAAVSSNRTIVPPRELVDISNRLLELGTVLERLMRSHPDPVLIDEASRIYLDAKVGLGELRAKHAC
jgi:hypothetical protein